MLDPAFLRPIAHRGLHAAAHGLVENTGPAALAAIAKGYGIECDVRPAKGGLPVVFHDTTIDRLIAGSGPLTTLGPGCLAKLPFRDAPLRGIPTLAEFLAIVGGRVPLLVEVKSEWTPPDASFLAEIARQALAYKGQIALMSFDPAVMVALRALAPAIPRGIVSGSYDSSGGEGWWPGAIDDARRPALANLLESGPADPAFYAYHVASLPTAVTRYVREVQGLPLFAWTIRTPVERRIASTHADAPVFEGYEA